MDLITMTNEKYLYNVIAEMISKDDSPILPKLGSFFNSLFAAGSIQERQRIINRFYRAKENKTVISDFISFSRGLLRQYPGTNPADLLLIIDILQATRQKALPEPVLNYFFAFNP